MVHTMPDGPTDRRTLTTTDDGSETLFSERFQQHYHSIFGAARETQRVFIELGLQYAWEVFGGDIQLFEVGFGTGLNAWMTAMEAQRQQKKVSYTGVEAYPVAEAITRQFLWPEYSLAAVPPFAFTDLHTREWNETHALSPRFLFRKLVADIATLPVERQYHLIYFDAFAPSAQPELWSVAQFENMAARLMDGGILTTYCSKSSVQRNLKAAGFAVEKHPGPPRKREVLRAIYKA